MPSVITHQTNTQETLAPDDLDIDDALVSTLYAAIFELTEEECKELYLSL